MLSLQNRPTYYNSLTYNKILDLLSAMDTWKEDKVFTQMGKQTQTERERETRGDADSPEGPRSRSKTSGMSQCREREVPNAWSRETWLNREGNEEDKGKERKEEERSAHSLDNQLVEQQTGCSMVLRKWRILAKLNGKAKLEKKISDSKLV